MDVIVKSVALPSNTLLELFLEKKRAEGINIQIIDKNNNNLTTGLEKKNGAEKSLQIIDDKIQYSNTNTENGI